MKHYKQIISLLTTIVICICLLSGLTSIAFADTEEDFTITGNADGYSYVDNVLTISSGGKYTISGSSSSYIIKVTSEEDVTITLAGVSITNTSASPIEIAGDGNVTIKLSGSNTLTARLRQAVCLTARAA